MVSIIDLNGQQIQSFKWGSKKSSVDLSHLESGIFILSFDYKGQAIRERFIKK
jgi:hypothetical protein